MARVNCHFSIEWALYVVLKLPISNKDILQLKDHRVCKKKKNTFENYFMEDMQEFTNETREFRHFILHILQKE